MNSAENSSTMLPSVLKLSEEQLSQIETLAATNYAPRTIAKYLDVNEKIFIKEWKEPTSLVRHHYDRGILEAEFLINNGLLQLAKAGNITASQEFRKIAEAKRVEELKTQILFSDET